MKIVENLNQNILNINNNDLRVLYKSAEIHQEHKMMKRIKLEKYLDLYFNQFV